MKKFGDVLHDIGMTIVSQFLRYFPIRYKNGLIKIGNPDENSPIFISGDFYTSVKRVIRCLKGQNCYLLVVDSAGINVWCAAGVGDLNEHKISDALNSSDLKNIVAHRKIIVPQLAAVGIDRAKLHQISGFKIIWGPANAYDIKKFIDNKLRATPEMRLVRFAYNDRVSLAFGQLFNYYFLFIYYFAFTWIFGIKFHHEAIFVAALLFYTIGMTLVNFKFPSKWPPNNVLLFGLLPLAAVLVYTLKFQNDLIGKLPFYLIAIFIITLAIAIDTVGSSVFYKSKAFVWMKRLNVKSLFQPEIIHDKCTKCTECIKVCPKGIFALNGSKTMEVYLENDCCECLACVKHCDFLAIKNINGKNFKHDIKVISQEVYSEVMK